ncbi:uncharacterized protein [Clytia hemisphaerica]|uniref:Uncharacterized protein n=1 Tax=Clytia hemisphaerica TaxID=252671 RepID=A0A7M5V5Z7_9CNID
MAARQSQSAKKTSRGLRYNTPSSASQLIVSASSRSKQTPNSSSPANLNNANNMSGISPFQDDTEITQRDLDQLKDAVRKETRNLHDAQTSKMTSLEEQISTLQGKINILEASVTSKKNEKEPVPPLCTNHFKNNYKKLNIDQGWRFTETFKSQYNLDVTAGIVKKVKDTGLGFQETQIFSAAKAHYTNLRRSALEKDDAPVKRKRNSRRDRLHKKRTKILSISNPSEEDKELWSLTSPYVMSDEETDDDGTKTFRRPKWRNLNLNNLIDRIDATGSCVRTYSNTPATRIVDASQLAREVLDLEPEDLEPEDLEPEQSDAEPPNGDSDEAS